MADHWASNPYVVESQMPNLPVFRLRPEDGDGPIKILHRNHLLPLTQKVCPDQVPDVDTPPPMRVLRRRRKRKNIEKSKEEKAQQVTLDEKSGREEVEPDDTADKEYTDSEDEEYGMWYDLSVDPLQCRRDEVMSEPFGLDLDVLFNDQDGQPEAVEQGVTQDCVEEQGMDKGSNVPESGIIELQETSGTQEKTQGEDPLDTETSSSQRDIETDIDNDTMTQRTQRVRRPPLKLTYDVPGHPSVRAAHAVRYVSCLYRYIGVPVVA